MSDTEAETTASEVELDSLLEMDDETAQEILAEKQARGVAVGWGPFKKATIEIPERMVGVEFTILQPKAGETPEETWENILAFSEDHVAALDTWNSAYRLANQKEVKGHMRAEDDEEELEVPQLQEISNRHKATQHRRRRSKKGSAKARAERAEAKVAVASQTMEEMIERLAEVDPEQAEQYRERLAALS